ncbi:tyrosine-type recombinase/integrase [Nonomuraea wenchangensis]|uniref:tyrosine-type recombinase/integrase n=1 Tax=Nonomuraea wenchangensis TaxID=568860 RepID=UPI003446C1EA
MTDVLTRPSGEQPPTAVSISPLTVSAAVPATVGLAFFQRPAAERRPVLATWVAALPALGPVEMDDADGVHRLTALWLDHYAGRSAHTAESYATDLRLWLDYCAAKGWDALRVRRADVRLYATDQTERHATSTAARRLASLSSWYEWLLDNEATGAMRNPVPKTGRPRGQTQSSTTTALSAEQAAAFLDQAAIDGGARVTPGYAEQVRRRTAAMLAVALTTGARVGELTGANIGNVGHTEGYDVLWVRRKGGQRQPLRLEPPVLRLIHDYLDERGTRDPEAPLFVTVPHAGRPGGQRQDRKALGKLVRRIAKAAGIPSWATLTPHGLRHTFITLSLDAGAALRDVRDAAGHASVNTTSHYDRNRGRLARHPGGRVLEHLSHAREAIPVRDADC